MLGQAASWRRETPQSVGRMVAQYPMAAFSFDNSG